jgi:hypothetical protein
MIIFVPFVALVVVAYLYREELSLRALAVFGTV